MLGIAGESICCSVCMFASLPIADILTDSPCKLNRFNKLLWNIGYMSRCASLAMRVCLSISGESMAKVTQYRI